MPRVDWTYLERALDLVGEMRSTVVEDAAAYAKIILADDVKRRVFEEAYRLIVDKQDQKALEEACRNRRNPRAWDMTRLMVLFGVLGEYAVPPFGGFEAFPGTQPLKRASHLPGELQPFLEFGARMAFSNEELYLLELLDTMPHEDLAQLHALGRRLTSSLELRATLERWLKSERDSTDVDVVQRVLYLLDALDYQW